MSVWKPHVTVAAVVESEGRFLLVEERIDGRVQLNQPAGHLEPNEGLVAAVVRETLEETGHRLAVEALVGLYRWVHPDKGTTFLRATFCGHVGPRDPSRALDTGIIGPVWLGRDAIAARAEELRSPLVLRAIDDYLGGAHYPLELIQDIHGSVP